MRRKFLHARGDLKIKTEMYVERGELMLMNVVPSQSRAIIIPGTTKFAEPQNGKTSVRDETGTDTFAAE